MGVKGSGQGMEIKMDFAASQRKRKHFSFRINFQLFMQTQDTQLQGNIESIATRGGGGGDMCGEPTQCALLYKQLVVDFQENFVNNLIMNC